MTDISSKYGVLKNLIVDEKRIPKLKELAQSLPDVTLNDRQLGDFEMLVNGSFSPLEGYMCRTDYESVLDRMRLQNGLLWPLPICLDISEISARPLEAGQSVAVRDPEGFLLGILHIEDIWPVDKDKEADLLYGTRASDHAGVSHLFTKMGGVYIGGQLEAISLPIHYDSMQLRYTPFEIRNLFQKLKWNRVVAFQTPNPIHRPQYEMTLKAMQEAKANLLVLPAESVLKPGDFDHFTQIRCYRAIRHYYPPDSMTVNLIPLCMRTSGPRAALLHMIVAKNFGCTHFISANQHDDAGENDAWKVSAEYKDEINIEVIPFEEMVYLPFEDEYQPKSQVPNGTQTIRLSSADIRNRIRSGKKVPEWATFPEVLAEIQKIYPPPNKQGFTVFLTGLSGAGKSTIAKILHSRFLEMGDRPVTLLDGDIVRRNLSSQLTFSKEDRDINVRRIGFVACEITKNRGIAICAPIAPYAATRKEIRREIENYGGFIEIHVSTSLEVCESRDRKGMYAKARAGLITGFTGVDDPYETPQKPELRIDTVDILPEEGAQDVMLFLGQRGYI